MTSHRLISSLMSAPSFVSPGPPASPAPLGMSLVFQRSCFLSAPPRQSCGTLCWLPTYVDCLWIGPQPFSHLSTDPGPGGPLGKPHAALQPPASPTPTDSLSDAEVLTPNCRKLAEDGVRETTVTHRQGHLQQDKTADAYPARAPAVTETTLKIMML